MKAEDKLQTMCIERFDMAYPELSKMLIHVPNQRKCKVRISAKGKPYSPERILLARMGQRDGVSDLILLIKNSKHGNLCIEVKLRKGDIYRIDNKNKMVDRTTYQSKEQHEWELNAMTYGNKYVICRSVDEFMKEVNEYLNS